MMGSKYPVNLWFFHGFSREKMGGVFPPSHPGSLCAGQSFGDSGRSPGGHFGSGHFGHEVYIQIYNDLYMYIITMIIILIISIMQFFDCNYD